jgi:hypothetical protein
MRALKKKKAHFVSGGACDEFMRKCRLVLHRRVVQLCMEGVSRSPNRVKENGLGYKNQLEDCRH